MERNYKTILIIINITFALIIISIPTVILLAEYSNYSRIDESLTYVYSSTTHPLERQLNLNADVGKININYNTQPVDYLVKIDVNIEMAGPNLDGKSYLDLLNIYWENLTSPINFTLEIKSDMIADFSNLHKANININVLLRADVIFDINSSVLEGAVEVITPMGINLNNVFTNVINGNIFYDFTSCNILGNVTGIVNNGDITLKAYNNQYNQNCTLTFVNEIGYITIDIYQFEEMGANITGTGITKTGYISLIYNDYSPNIGAQFTLYNKTGFGVEGQNTWIGFERDTLPLMAGQFFYSKDFPTQNNYNFTLFKWDGGDYFWNLYSVPT
ncbi:MAG: hypothetical protein ACFE9X_07295 [Promethearchaeota archaeon]